MANEALIRTSLQITKDNLSYRNLPNSYQADISVGNGPTPGVITASLAGTNVDLSALSIPGFCFIQNLDTTNFVEVGIWDGVSFYPMLDFLAGEGQIVRLSASLGDEFGTGTGTSGAGINRLRIKADTAPCLVSVEAFDR